MVVISQSEYRGSNQDLILLAAMEEHTALDEIWAV